MTAIKLYVAVIACLVLSAFIWVAASDYVRRHRAIRNQRNGWH
jgi:hypothetical protein